MHEPDETGRKLLVFSDSRQDAAFFAPYFNRTYMQILRRNLIIRTIQERKTDVLENRWRLRVLLCHYKERLRILIFFPG